LLSRIEALIESEVRLVQFIPVVLVGNQWIVLGFKHGALEAN
jgi:hypothetical protein